ncbi:MAG TPA: 3'-5' exoribonuclease [Terracidiphilus sp.]|nr:3'-5' exoribonuclease [Terracidiphilus sp.]
MSLITLGIQVVGVQNPCQSSLLISSVWMSAIAKPHCENTMHSSPFSVERTQSEDVDVYFSADVETDGPIPGQFSMLSFGLVYSGCFDGKLFSKPTQFNQNFYRELRPISDEFQLDALRVNGLDRAQLLHDGTPPDKAMTEAAQWVRSVAGQGRPILVAYPLSFDWSFLYWYFVRFSLNGSPFNHSQCFDIKTAFAVKARIPIASAGRSKLMPGLRPNGIHTHNALEDAIEQAEVFANLFEWGGTNGEHA